MYRLGRHFSELEKNTHAVAAMQKDWNDHGRENFVFRPVEIGPQ